MADKARKRFTDAKRQLRDSEREMKGLGESLDKDWGPDNVFAVYESPKNDEPGPDPSLEQDEPEDNVELEDKLVTFRVSEKIFMK